MKKGTYNKRKVSQWNKSPSGWWIGSYLLRFEFNDEQKKNLNRRCKAWENTVLVKAKDRVQAYRKVCVIGHAHHGQEFRTEGTDKHGCLRFEGLTMLLPVYQKLEDGAEVLWREYEALSVKSVRSMVRAKHQLEAFDIP
jgi:hypothetical protein